MKKLRRSELLDLSITLEPGELTQLCDLTGVTNTIIEESTGRKVDLCKLSCLFTCQQLFDSLG